MCNRDTNKNNNSVIEHLIRKSRTKTRRPKFLSLRSELISPELNPMSRRNPPSPPQKQKQKQLTLFPLHPENLVEDRDQDDVALIFENNAASSCCSLQSFLPSYQNDMSSTSSSSSEEEEEESRNLAEEQSFLVRTAMRSRARETAEEKWVSYSEVVEEATSTAGDDEWMKKMNAKMKKKKKKKKMMTIGKQLWLKLDYEGIMNAWSDKAPLFINGESPQTVPDLHHHHPTLSSDYLPNRSLVMDGMGSEENNNHNNNNNNVWKVPEIMGMKKEELLGQREASVLRYKEKRQNRLFSKRIRYQVRKLNAEKRPRMKGRFVKRS